MRFYTAIYKKVLWDAFHLNVKSSLKKAQFGCCRSGGTISADKKTCTFKDSNDIVKSFGSSYRYMAYDALYNSWCELIGRYVAIRQ
jgi:hypothetical protein